MGARILIHEAAEQCGLPPERLVRIISLSWIDPVEPSLLDEEDIARARLIRELQEDFGVNDAAVPIILHLVDQLQKIRRELRAH